jgi:UDP-GlcNAc3NAcA epimerase
LPNADASEQARSPKNVIKIVSIVGARPQFIKAAPVSQALRERPDVSEVLVHTGQHYDDNMSAVFFRELDITPPQHNLGIGSGPQGAQTGRMLAAIEEVLLSEQPDWVIVYGDTNSTLAGALAAAKLHIPVAHVEAGLRSFNRAMPEELNRLVADHVADLLLAPTRAAIDNLAREGIAGPNVALVGDVMYDAVLHYGQVAEAQSTALDDLAVKPGQYVLATVHRAENTDDAARLGAIMSALRQLSDEIPVILPLHPRTRRAAEAAGLELGAGRRLRIVEAVGYLDMVMLERHARMIATDSGGVQKEAYFSRVPCVTLRTETEWVELVESGWNTLVPPVDPESVLRGLRSGLGAKPGPWRPFYGDGNAASAIAERILAAEIGSSSKRARRPA